MVLTRSYEEVVILVEQDNLPVVYARLSRRQAVRLVGGLVLGAGAAQILAACAPAVGREAPAAEVTMQGFVFVPESITVPVGGTVLWRNTDALVHTVTCDPSLAQRPGDAQLPDGAQPFNSGSMEPNDEFRHTFEVAGEYVYFCIPHELQGMIGRVTVQ